MCAICDYIRIKDPLGEDKYYLLNEIKRIALDHPWHFMVAPMSEPERVWYDPTSPFRKNNGKKETGVDSVQRQAGSGQINCGDVPN